MADENPPNLSEILIDRGYAYYQQKRYRHAKNDYEAAKRLLETRSYGNDDSKEQLILTARLIYLYGARGMYEEATGECDKLIEMCELLGEKYDGYLSTALKKKKEFADIDFTQEVQIDEDSAKLAK